MRTQVSCSFVRSFLLSSIGLCVAVPAFCQTSRPFLMGSTAIQAFQYETGVIFQNSGPGFSFEDLAPDVDVISVQPEFLGIPFAQFAKDSTLADEDPWAKQVTSLAESAKKPGKPLMVQITLVRGHMVGNAVYPDGLVHVQTNWAPACPDLTAPEYAALQPAYVNYALWIARTFSPQYFVIMLEPNLYYANCGRDTASWRLLVEIERETYRAVKAEFPSMILFPSFNLEAIYGLDNYYGQDPTGFDEAHYAAILGMKRDRLGLVSFPQLIGNPYKLPMDYYTRIVDRNPNEPRLILTETGWNSSTISFYDAANNLCIPKYSEPSFVSAFLNFVIYNGYAANFELITWWSDRDEMPAKVVSTCYPPAKPPEYLECNGDIWCTAVSATRSNPPPGTIPEFGEIAFKAFGTMGLRSYDGTPKDDTFAMWQKYLELPLEGDIAPADSGRRERRVR